MCWVSVLVSSAVSQITQTQWLNAMYVHSLTVSMGMDRHCLSGTLKGCGQYVRQASWEGSTSDASIVLLVHSGYW